MSTALAQDTESRLTELVGYWRWDPLAFVMGAYPWGEPGPLENDEPDKWQRDILIRIGQRVRERAFDGETTVTPIREAVSSGHGIGKSTMAAWLVNWIMTTRPGSQGTVTANTITQLKTKTWAAIQRWTKLCITRHWFDINSEMMWGLGAKESWYCSIQSSKEENSESFAGQHAAKATSFYIFDEDSAISEEVHHVAEGGLTDGEPMVFLFGNPTRNTGFFHEACFGRQRDLWDPLVVDSRQSKFTNKALIEEWAKTYGEDSDFFRVRVLGLPPLASDLQFIDGGRIQEAQKRAKPLTFPDEPLIAGVDVSDGGSAWNVIRFRCGTDARSIPPIRIPGEKVRESRSFFLAVLTEALNETYDGREIAAMFIDSAFGAPYVERLTAMGYRQVQEVRFGAPGPDRHQANLRAFMWSKMKDWLGTGGCIPKDDVRLETDLGAPGYHLDRQDRLVIESKDDMAKRGVASPDDGDALALTFAARVGIPRKKPQFKGSVPREFQWT